MSWRLAPLVACFALACSSGTMKVKKGEPQTAREKMLAEQKASKKNMDDEEVKPPGSKQWTGWRYQGERKDCFFLVGRRCFKSEKAACNAAKCKAPSKCETDGAGPATLSCSKTKS
jgi:hypothetical protein